MHRLRPRKTALLPPPAKLFQPGWSPRGGVAPVEALLNLGWPRDQVPLYSNNSMPQNQSMQFAQMAMNNYLLDHAYDEMFAAPGELHRHYEPLLSHFSSLPSDELQRRKQAADLSFLNQGITFTVYGRQEGTEKIFP